MQFKLEPIVLATHDGVVTGMSHNTQKHPLYGTDAFDVSVRMPLTGIEKLYAAELLDLRKNIETIRFSIRSWAAQLGLAAFNPECTDIRLRDSCLEIDTLVSDIANEDDNILLSSLRRNAEKKSSKIGRTVLLHPSAQIGEKHLPLDIQSHFRFDRTKLNSNELQKIWLGASGREAILAIRRDLGKIPDVLLAGQYLVGTVDANTENNCWLLEPDLMRGDRTVPVLHDQSCLFDPLRTVGKRQVEIRNTNGIEESLHNISIKVSVYRTNLDLYHCVHRQGV